jgi:hypothetical protein
MEIAYSAASVPKGDLDRMARHDEAARKIAVEEPPAEEPRAPQAYTTGEYDFFRSGSSAPAAPIVLPLSSGGWILPLLGCAVLALLTFLLLN